MEPEKKESLPELPVPDEPEKPEEGFVPYCGSDEAEAGQKAGRKSNRSLRSKSMRRIRKHFCWRLIRKRGK